MRMRMTKPFASLAPFFALADIKFSAVNGQGEIFCLAEASEQEQQEQPRGSHSF